MAAEVIYVLCTAMSTICTAALYRGYGKTQNKLLLWSAGCFALLAFGDIFRFIDLILFPNVDLHGPFWRALISAAAGCALLFGLILEVS